MSDEPLDSEAQMLRGASFIGSYAVSSGQPNVDTSSEASTIVSSDIPASSPTTSGKVKRREPTMLRNGATLIPPPADKDGESKKYTIVLDLDETAVYAREGPLFARAHLQSLLRVMNQHCEVVVWTAGERQYAKAILREIDSENIIKHLVYRHKTWFDPKDYTKDLCKLGRDLDYVLIVENTPDCVRLNPQNGIIVSDFEGVPEASEVTSPTVQQLTPPPSPTLSGKQSSKPQEDHTFVHLMQLVRELGASGEPVAQFLSRCRLLRRQVVRGSNGEDIPIFFLTSKKRVYRPRARSDDSQPQTDAKVVKTNRDKADESVPSACAAPPSIEEQSASKRPRESES